MSYENAPATGLLATNCACCGRPLLDAQSVTLGVGPTCRERHGYRAMDALTEPERIQANALIHEAAAEGAPLERIEAIASTLQLLGMVVLAGKIRDRFFARATVHVTTGTQQGRPALLVTTPWADGAARAFSDTFKRSLGAQARAPFIDGEGKFKGWLVWLDADPGAVSYRRKALWNALRAHFAGFVIESARGRAVIA